MSKQLVSGKHRLRNTYWSLVGAASATILSVQPVMAETIWDRFSTIMRDKHITSEAPFSQDIPFIMRCIKVADELSAAAVTRAIENPVPRGMRVPLKIRIKDIVYLMMVICSNRSVLDEGAGNGNSLLLAAGERIAAFAHHGFIAVRQCRNKAVV